MICLITKSYPDKPSASQQNRTNLRLLMMLVTYNIFVFNEYTDSVATRDNNVLHVLSRCRQYDRVLCDPIDYYSQHEFG